jgi:hypothetical protein
MLSLTEEREQLAAQWERQASDRMLLIEPDSWLRMECGQVAEIAKAAPAREPASVVWA